MLNICVAGWYLDAFDDWYASLYRVKDKYRVHVVANRESDYLATIDLPHTVRGNTGLEWGAYHYYLMRVWDGHGGVLFCHDDIEMLPVVVDGEIVEPEYVFDKIAESGVDAAYIFGSRHEDVENRGMHGRMIYMGEQFLRRVREDGGFYHDHRNHGYTDGEDSHLRDEYGCEGYNAGILAFDAQRKRIGGDVNRKMYIPAFSLAKRGVRGSAVVHYGQWMDRVGREIEDAEKKLHIGCGDNYWASHTNVDLHNRKADILADACDLPVGAESYDLVESHHLIEHMPKSKAERALAEWLRVLKPGGKIFLSCPDIVAFFDLLRDSDAPEVWDSLLAAVYGQEAPGMAHQYGYSRRSLRLALEAAGFVDVEVKTAVGHRPTPSLLAFARKAVGCD